MGDLPFTQPVDNLSIRRGYDAMPLAADHRLDAIETAGGLPLFKAVDDLSNRRGYESVASSTGSKVVGRAYSQGVVTQAIPTASTDPVGTAYTQGLLIGSVKLSVVAGADPVDTPWGPRSVGAGTSTSVPDTRGGVPSQIAKGSNWVRTPEGNRPLP